MRRYLEPVVYGVFEEIPIFDGSAGPPAKPDFLRTAVYEARRPAPARSPGQKSTEAESRKVRGAPWLRMPRPVEAQ